jgi:adenylate kinase family enzyme
MIHVIFVLGGPGSGKGTLCQDLKKDGWLHISVGELLREHAKKDSKIDQLLKKGNLVASRLSVDVLENYLNTLDDNSRVLIDGFPRNETNWEEFQKRSIIFKIHIHCIIFLEATKEIMLSRIINRASSSSEQRSDDNIEIFEHRYKLYLESLKVLEKPELKYIMKKIDSNGPAEEVSKKVRQVFKNL